MKKISLHILLYACILVQLLSCITPYEPEIKEELADILVVEAIIQEGYNTVVKLSKARPIDAKHQAEAVAGTVFILCDDGNRTPMEPLKENGVTVAGSYVPTSPVTFNLQAKYALHITAEGKEYQSEFVVPMKTPAIDQVIWKENKAAEQLEVFVSAHDADNQVACYQWVYEENWEHLANAYTDLWYDPVTETVNPININESNNVYHCWKTAHSSQLVIGNAENLVDYTIRDQRVALIDLYENDDRFNYLYSLNVKQYGLTTEAYTYYKNLQTNLEETGSLFAAQPTELEGNIVCLSDPKEVVIGYIAAATESSMRIFISKEELETTTVEIGDCGEEVETNSGLTDYARMKKLYREEYRIRMVDKQTYRWTPARCIDCTFRGGTKNKPDFWPNDHL